MLWRTVWSHLIRSWSNWVMAFALAFMIWVVAEMQSNPNQTQRYPYPVPLEIRNKAPNLVVVNQLPNRVEVHIQAPRSVWEHLLNSRGVHAYIDLQGLKAGTYEVPVHVEIEAHPYRLVDYQPKKVEVVLEEYISKQLPVTIEVQGNPAVGYRFGTLEVSPSQVTVRGPRHLVEKVEEVKARLYVENVRSTVERWLSLQPYDARERPVEGVQLEPEQVYVVLPVEQLGGYRDVSVRVRIEGQPKRGYHVANIAVYPPVVTLYTPNPAEALKLPGFVETEPVDITGATADVEVRVPLVLPEGVQVVGENKVLVQIAIEPIESSVQVQLPVEVVGLRPEYYATVSPQTVDVVFLGPADVMQNFKLESVRAFVDVEGLEPGTYTLPVEIEVLLDGVRVESLHPDQVEVVLQAGTPPPVTPTPTPSAR